VSSFFGFYTDSYFHPYILRVGRIDPGFDLHGCWRFQHGRLVTAALDKVCACLQRYDNTTTFDQASVINGHAYQICHTRAQSGVKIWYRADLEGQQTRDSVSRVAWEGDSAEIIYNAAEFVQYSALMNVVVIIVVVVLLVGFSTTINHKINEMVLQPLDRIFSSIKDAMSDVMCAINTTSAGTASDKLDGDLRRTQSYHPGERRKETELDILEVALQKLASIGNHVTAGPKGGASKDMVAVMEDHELDESTKEWLRDGYTTGHVHTSLTKAAKLRRGGLAHIAVLPRGSLTDTMVSEKLKLSRQASKVQLRKSLSLADKGHVSKALIETFDYDVILYSNDELHYHVHWIFTETNCIADFGVSNEKSVAFVKGVCAEYQDTNPYHNFRHAADAMQTVYMFIRANGGDTFLSGIDIFAALVAALGHDIGHPGVNAAYLVNTRHELAMAYNDTSVLENMHCATLYNLLRDERSLNLFENLEDGDWKLARKTIVSAILATDMVHHFELVHEADVFFTVNEGKLANTAERVALFRDNPKNADFLVRLWMHAADISNPVKNFAIVQKWCTAVTDEFFAQGDREKAEGIPVSAMMDRATTNTAQLQVNFIEFVVGPLYVAVIKIFPELFELGIQICYNRKQWGNTWMADLEREASNEAFNPLVGAGATVGGGRGKKGALVDEWKKNNGRRRAFEEKFSFVYMRQKHVSLTNLTRHLRVPGAKPFNFSGSAGPINGRNGSTAVVRSRVSSTPNKEESPNQIGRDISASNAKPITRSDNLFQRVMSRGQLRRKSDDRARQRQSTTDSLDVVAEQSLQEIWVAPPELESVEEDELQSFEEEELELEEGAGPEAAPAAVEPSGKQNGVAMI
jgi:hypothetical protein